jgi:transposase-like protein
MSKRKVKNYTLEFKQSSAKLASTSDQPISQTARDLGVHITTLHGWVRKYHPRAISPTELPTATDLTTEVKQLRKEVARLKQERDILKKAAAYFASETQ